MAGEGDAERLVVLLEARIRDFEKNMQKASGTADQSYGRMRQSSRSATRDMEADMQRSTSRINQLLAGTSTKIGSFGVAFAGGIGAGMIAALAPMALFQKALEAVNSASHLVDVADKVGLTTGALQELGFGFSQAGVDAASFETGMEQFSKRIGEAATQGGKLADILNANGVAMRDSNGKIKSSEELLRSYANLVKNAASEQEKMLLVTEAFGRGGGAMLVGLSDGAEGIDKMTESARKAGVVIDDELLRRAEEMGDQWDAAWMRFKVNSQSAILSAMQGMTNFGTQVSDITDALDDMWNNPSLRNFSRVMVGDDATSSMMGKDSDARVREAFKGGATDALTKADAALIVELQKRYKPVVEKAASTIIPGKPDKPEKGAKNKNIPRTADDRLSDNIQSVKDRIAALQEEQATMGMSFEAQQKRKVALDLEQAALRQVREEARKKGVVDWENIQLSQKQKDAIDEVSSAYAAQADELRKNQEVQQLQADVLKGAFGDIRSALEDGKITMEEWGKIGLNVMDKIIDKIENDLVDAIMQIGSGGGGSGGIFGSILGLLGIGGGGTSSFIPGIMSGARVGLFADGTANTGGQRGEPMGVVHGQEAVIPLPNGGRVPVQMMGGGGGGSNSPQPYVDQRVYNFTGTSEEFQQFKQFVAQRDAQFDGRAVQALKGYHAAGGNI